MPNSTQQAFGQLGMQAGTGVLGAAIGMALGNYNDRRQRMQQDKLWQMELKNRKEMTDYEMEKEYEMWLKTNYAGQKEQLQKAGLNPGLLYGMSGGGGVTTGTANGNVSGAEAPKGGGEFDTAVRSQGMGMQLALLKAQKENIEADTANKLSQVPGHQGEPAVQQQGIAESGQRITESKGKVDLMAQQEDNERIKNNLLRIEESIARMNEFIKQNTMGNEVMKSAQEVANLIEAVKQNKLKTGVKEATVNDEIKYIKQEAIGRTLENWLTVEQTKSTAEHTRLTGWQIRKIANEIESIWMNTGNQLRKSQLDAILTDSNTDPVNHATDQLTNVLNVILGAGVVKGIMTPQPPAPVKGFNRGNNQY